MTTLQIDIQDAIPETTRPAKESAPNPFKPHFPTAEGKSLVVTVPAIKVDGKIVADEKGVRKVVTQARNAAKAIGKTARVAVADPDEGSRVLVTVWTVDQITRPRKPKEDVPETLETPAAKAK